MMKTMMNEEEIRIGDCLCYVEEEKYVFCRVKTIVPDYDERLFCEYFSISSKKCVCRQHAVFPRHKLALMHPCTSEMFNRVVAMGHKLHDDITSMFFNLKELPMPKQIKAGDCFVSKYCNGYWIDEVKRRDPDCKRKVIVHLSVISQAFDTIEYDYRWKATIPSCLREYVHVDPILLVKYKKLIEMTALVVRGLFERDVRLPQMAEAASLDG